MHMLESLLLAFLGIVILAKEIFFRNETSRINNFPV